jgi:hypothetical protein
MYVFLSQREFECFSERKNAQLFLLLNHNERAIKKKVKLLFEKNKTSLNERARAKK